MATGYALFPGRSDIDQLFKIFQRRGTPNNDIWPNCTRLPYFNPDFPQWRSRHIREFVQSSNSSSIGTNSNSASGNEGNGGNGVFDSVSGHAADLLEQLLQYDPERRLVCKAALQHPFFFEN